MSKGSDMIAAERARQVTEEGYTAEHDQDHAAELAWAARCYVENTGVRRTGQISRSSRGRGIGPTGSRPETRCVT